MPPDTTSDALKYDFLHKMTISSDNKLIGVIRKTINTNKL